MTKWFALTKKNTASRPEHGVAQKPSSGMVDVASKHIVAPN